MADFGGSAKIVVVQQNIELSESHSPLTQYVKPNG